MSQSQERDSVAGKVFSDQGHEILGGNLDEAQYVIKPRRQYCPRVDNEKPLQLLENKTVFNANNTDDIE